MEQTDSAASQAEICFICAEPIKYYAVPQCNHRTCHVCSLRLRALYKKLDCTFCKEPQPTVILTESPDAGFASFSPESIPYKDSRLSIFFETQEMMDDALLLLRFNCADESCDYIANGWGDLRLHVRAAHNKLMCDLCIRSKKVFAHEHALYNHNQLVVHLPSMPHRAQRTTPKDIEGGIHPYCEFCRECFFSDDELYSHMRERHEDCFICKKNDIRDLYFQNYDSLEKHFNKSHFACQHATCLTQKFVVFNTALDLQGHMMDAHRGEMSAKDLRDAQRIHVDFEESFVPGSGRRGGGRQRGGAPEPSIRQQAQPPPPSAQPARVESGGRRRVIFGSSLTSENTSGPASAAQTPPQSRSQVHTPDLSQANADPAVLERHAALIHRLESMTPNKPSAVPAVKAAIRGYRSSEASAKDLISTVWAVLDQKLEGTASIINAFVDLLEEEDKKQDLLASWRAFDIEQRRQFPELAPRASTSSGGGYAGIASGRLLNIKHTSSARSSNQSSRRVWDRVAQAAGQPPANGSTPRNAFPSLQAKAGPAPRVVPGSQAPTWKPNKPSMVAPAPAVAFPSLGASSSRPFSVSRPAPGPRATPPKINNSMFPELPTATNIREKPPISGNSSLRNILGSKPPPSNLWNGSSSSSNMDPPTSESTAAAAPQNSSKGKGKKGKGKTVYTLSSFQAG
ncbi:hypothetical protein BDV98DRAFT_578801 [Pterulicium gracile]|uniref:RING-type E3 ubiquitin transferase n=1 Tax=Pterulicium gracile TaxID=1884261 RepID=A0A5C3R2I6_9AGAR|nr:hypothetical protein BDV98DRAFT_578801 [Pterula gracilis]